MRKADIFKRRESIYKKIAERNELINEKFLREKRRKEELQEYKKTLEGVEDPEENNFNEEAFLENFDSNNPEIEIPDEVEIYIDEDFDLPFEAIQS